MAQLKNSLKKVEAKAGSKYLVKVERATSGCLQNKLPNNQCLGDVW